MGAFFIFVVFSALVLGTLADRDLARAVRRKAGGEWVLDGAGLFVQGTLIPLLAAFPLAWLLAKALPGVAGRLAVPGWAGFLLSFVLVDYAYYWNHRLLHTRRGWPIHQVHHTVTVMDVVGTSRNTLWSSFFIVYLWANALFLFTLKEPLFYAMGATLTSALDLWRHSALGPRQDGLLDRLLSPWLVLPRDHAWHHGSATVDRNFGANLKVWDRLHGTWQAPEGTPALGVPLEMSLAKKLFWPFAG